MKMRRLFPWLVAGFVGLYTLLPLLWLARLSITPEIQMHQWPQRMLPTTVTISHYLEIIADKWFWIQLGNSLLVCLIATGTSLAAGAMGAYALARFRFSFRNAVLLGLMGLHLLPGMANMSSVYHIADNLNALNSLLFVALLKTGGVTLAILILVAAFKNVPEKLEHCAMLDGLSRSQVLWRITLPLAGPGILAAGLLLFIQSWNTFFLPFLLLESPSKMTLTVGLYQYFSEHGFAQGHVAAFMILSIIPVLLLFMFFRNRLWRNIEI